MSVADVAVVSPRVRCVGLWVRAGSAAATVEALVSGARYIHARNYSNTCNSCGMEGREVLRAVLADEQVSQSELSRVSGVKQPSISQFLSGRIDMSDGMLDRLLSCLGFRLEVIRRPVLVQLDRSHLRSWRLHRQLATLLTPGALDDWAPTIGRNLARLRRGTRGEPHASNLDRWQRLVDDRDVAGLRMMMTGLDTDSVQMREVSPLAGLLPQSERTRALGTAGRSGPAS